MPTFPTTLDVPSEDAGKRLDQFLVAAIPEVSRARIQQLIQTQMVLVDKRSTKASLKLRGGERITVLGPVQAPPLRAIAEEIPLDIVYEDEDFAVVNKPAGMKVHAGAGATADDRNRGTLVNALLHRFKTLSGVGGELRPGIVHRLDRNTSGLIIVAKNDTAHRKLAEQFSSRQVRKNYLALVHGWVKQDTGTINRAISRDSVRRTRMTTRRSGGREAITHWKTIERFESEYGKFTLLELKIDTGRTHQIRVHMASIGHPVVGDTLYGAAAEIKLGGKTRSQFQVARGSTNLRGIMALGRNFLHAAALEFKHPRTGAALSFSRPLPRELGDFLACIRPYSEAAQRGKQL